MWNKLILLLILASLLSCNNKMVFRKKKIQNRTEDIIKSFNKNNKNFETYSIKYGGKFLTNDKSIRFNGLLRIKDNSKIWVNISVGFGIEIARALLTTDSIKFFNRHDKTYFCVDYKYFKRKYNIDVNYNIIQSFLTNNFVLSDKTNVNVNEEDSANIELNYIDSSKHETSYILNTELNRLTKIMFKNFQDNSQLDVTFTDFFDVKHKKLPKHINLDVSNKNSKFSLELKYKRIIINLKIKTPFRVPSKYKMICP